MQSNRDRSSQAANVWISLLAVIVLILYGSLYPFQFSLPQKTVFLWSVPHTLGSIRDFAINVIMYVPVGFLLGKALPESAAGWITALFAGFTLSAVVEYLQSFDLGRVSSALDLVMNTAGTAVGLGCASFIQLHSPAGLSGKLKRNPAAFGLILCMAASQLFPFFPRVHPAEWRQTAAYFFTAPFALAPFLLNVVEWLGVRSLLVELFETAEVTPALLAVTLSIPVALLFTGPPPVWPELAAAFSALVIGLWWRPTPQKLIPWFWLNIAGRELAPFHFLITPHAFQWIPFASLMEAGPTAVNVLFRKCFTYGTAIWLVKGHTNRATLLLAGLLLVLEFGQCYLPGRTPEVTDAVLTLVLGGSIVLLKRL